MKRISSYEKAFAYTKLDFIFPWHMRLGKHEKTVLVDKEGKVDAEAPDSDPNEQVLTPFKTFNRRRAFMVWLFNKKFEHLFTEDQI